MKCYYILVNDRLALLLIANEVFPLINTHAK
jgi:hypothetical protein